MAYQIVTKTEFWKNGWGKLKHFQNTKYDFLITKSSTLKSVM